MGKSVTVGAVFVVGVGLLAAVSAGIARAIWNDLCTVHVRPIGMGLSETVGEVVVPSQCEKGYLRWDYPRGTAQVIFHNPRPFTVCLTPDLGPLLSSIAMFVNGHEVHVNSPKEGETMCLPQHGQEVTVVLEQPPFLTYVTMYNYTLHF